MPEKRLGTTARIAILALAVTADVCGLIPFVGGFFALPFVAATYLVLAMNGVPVLGDTVSRWANTLGTLLVEQIPIINILPVFTISALLTIRTTDREDKEMQQQYTYKVESQLQDAGRRRPRTARAVAVFFVCAGLTLVTADARAQFDIAGLRELSITTTPKSAEPFENVRASITSYSIDLQTAQVTWTKNNEVIARGVGILEVSFDVGDSGTVTTISVTAEPLEGTALTASAVLRPASVGLVWEAQTYTPPFYKGKALHGPGSRVTFVAFPQLVTSAGTFVDPTTLTYTWRRNGQVIPTAGGVGRRVLSIFNDTFMHDLVVGVEAATKDGLIVARKTISVPVTSPQLLLYRYDPLFGEVLERAISTNLTLPSTGGTLVAEPYHMSATTRDDNELAYTWRVGTENTNAGGTIDLRGEGVGEGTSNVTVSVRHLKQLLQNAAARVVVAFTGANTSSETEEF